MILVSRAPIHKNFVVSSRADSIPVHLEDIVRTIGEVLEEDGGLILKVTNQGKALLGKLTNQGKVRLV